tara:strand:+ start:8764 stop:10347 length:1584 start_codon:yes stop_codon:yes gene_type:complete
MKIKSVTIQNFYSFKNAKINFKDFQGLVVIKGINKDVGGSNGSGKSAVVEALYFGLTGKTIRKSTEDTLVNNEAKKNCKVEVELSKGIKIIRQKKPTKLEFFVNNENCTQESVSHTQSLIDETLNINYKVLLASMFFGQENHLNFLDCSADDKRLIIKNFLNLEEIFEMRDRIKGFKSKYNQTIKQQDAIIREQQRTITSLDNKIQKTISAKEKYRDFSDDILNLSLSEVLEQEKQESSRLSQVSEVTRNLHVATLDRASVMNRINNIDKPSVCTSCKQAIVNKDDIQTLSESLKDLDSHLEELVVHSHELGSISKAPLISSKDYENILEYKDLCRDETNYLSIKGEIREGIVCAEVAKLENKGRYEVMRFWEKALSEHGLIKYIIRNILDFFNERANYYLSYLSDNKYFIEFDEELSEKIGTNNKIIPYISMSGGEKRKINLAVMLSLKDLLLFTDKNQSNIIFFDEVAENLDEQGVTGLYNLLQEIKKDKTIFVITHNKYLKTLLDSAPRLSIIKSKGASTVLEK